MEKVNLILLMEIIKGIIDDSSTSNGEKAVYILRLARMLTREYIRFVAKSRNEDEGETYKRVNETEGEMLDEMWIELVEMSEKLESGSVEVVS